MSVTDTLVRLLSAPWQSGTGHPVAATPLPGLRSEVIRDLASSNPGTLNAELCQWLRMSCGIAHTPIGDIDFTGQWYPEEPLAVLRPCLTLTIDDAARRWVAEAVEGAGLPGPVWCVFPHPAVTVYVSDDLGRFLSRLYERTRRGQTLEWLQGLTSEVRAIWAYRHASAVRSRHVCRRDRALRGWLSGLPVDARIYDLRGPEVACGWPHGAAGPAGRHYRCGRLPLFAVADAWVANSSLDRSRSSITGADFPHFSVPQGLEA
jgi:hypothetical protein